MTHQEAMSRAAKITIADEELATLNLWVRLDASTRLATRARIILLAAEGATDPEIASQLGISSKTAARWRRRFAKGRLAGIEKEAPRSRRVSKARDAMVRLILDKTTLEQPVGAPRWTTRSLAKELGISPSMVQRVWKAHGLN
jgi:transposase